MALNNPQAERFELLAYSPGLQDSSDLEAATKTISETSEPAGADYTYAATITAPTDARLAVTRLGVRIQVTVDSFGGGGAILNYRIKRGGTSIGTGTLATAGGTGSKLASHDVTSGTLTGAATYTLHLWTDAGTCVLSVARISVGVGTAAGAYAACMSLTHTGLAVATQYTGALGSGAPYAGWQPGASYVAGRYLTSMGSYNGGTLALAGSAVLIASASGANDLAYVIDVSTGLRSA